MYSNGHNVSFIIIENIAAPFEGLVSAVLTMPFGSLPLVGDILDIQCTDGGILRDMYVIGRKFDLTSSPFSCDIFICSEMSLHEGADDEDRFK